MFQWDKSMPCIEVDSGKVLHLFKSMREVQLALPGVSAQESSAYLCQYVHDNGVATVAAFHLHKNDILAFYHKDPMTVPVSKADGMLDEGLNFVESMGFLLTDQDIHLLEPADQQMLWESLPLKAGAMVKKQSPASAKPEQAPVEKAASGLVKKSSGKPAEVSTKKTLKTPAETVTKVKAKAPAAAPVKDTIANAPADEVPDNVDDLLAAVEAMRAKRPGLRARKATPSPEEMDRRKQQLRENIGRILASQ